MPRETEHLDGLPMWVNGRRATEWRCSSSANGSHARPTDGRRDDRTQTGTPGTLHTWERRAQRKWRMMRLGRDNTLLRKLTQMINVHQFEVTTLDCHRDCHSRGPATPARGQIKEGLTTTTTTHPMQATESCGDKEDTRHRQQTLRRQLNIGRVVCASVVHKRVQPVLQRQTMVARVVYEPTYQDTLHETMDIAQPSGKLHGAVCLMASGTGSMDETSELDKKPTLALDKGATSTPTQTPQLEPANADDVRSGSSHARSHQKVSEVPSASGGHDGMPTQPPQVGGPLQSENTMKLMKDDSARGSPVPRLTCNHCAVICAKPVRCSKCRIAVYCSSGCQQNDWKEHT